MAGSSVVKRDPDGRWLEGQDKIGPGRPPGRENRTTRLVKEGIECVYLEMGGHAGFLEWARKNPDIFYERVLVKLLPHQVRAELAVGTDFVDILQKAKQRAGVVIDS